MIKQLLTYRMYRTAKAQRISQGQPASSSQLSTLTPASQHGFTLIETLVALLLITVAIIAPMSLVTQSLLAAYYARDQITASNLAEEGIELIRSARDDAVLSTAEGNTVDLLGPILSACTTACYIDTTKQDNPPVIVPCASGGCPKLNVNSSLGLYGYSSGDGWSPSDFTRTITVQSIRTDANNNNSTEEIKVTSIVSWKTINFQTQGVTLSENMYNWVSPGAGAGG
ncbi:MAG TPA: prepilin-type N-terminal cleavage/methylation domain-containing protein [Candidatus Paceibacterota bacterium]|nr:prepilin-type N-terminal cleavage/methylation domain-containing protein [Candidatus Paceibacterota bacterium]